MVIKSVTNYERVKGGITKETGWSKRWQKRESPIQLKCDWLLLIVTRLSGVCSLIELNKITLCSFFTCLDTFSGWDRVEISCENILSSAYTACVYAIWRWKSQKGSNPVAGFHLIINLLRISYKVVAAICKTIEIR